MKKLFKEFKEFISRGNVLTLAVGMIIGGAFTAIVTCLTENLLQPIINYVLGNPDPNWHISNAFSSLLTAILQFLITAIVLFAIVKAVNAAMNLTKKKEEAAPTTKKCPYCLSEIPIEATRCAHCTSELPAPEKK